MRKYYTVLFFSVLVFLLTRCSFPTEVARKVNEAVRSSTSYTYDVQKIFTFHCSPCHFPVKGGNKRSYDNFSNVKEDIDEIIRRVQLSPGDEGYMPLQKPKLSNDDIALLKKWKADGLQEK